MSTSSALTRIRLSLVSVLPLFAADCATQPGGSARDQTDDSTGQIGDATPTEDIDTAGPEDIIHDPPEDIIDDPPEDIVDDPPETPVDDADTDDAQTSGMTFHEQTVHDFAIDTFNHIRNVVAPEDETPPEAEFIGHHIRVSSEEWVYVLDDGGQQIFKPRAMFPHIEPSLSTDITPSLHEWMEATVPQSTVDEAKRLALDALSVNYMGDATVTVATRRELIALKDLNLDTPLRHHAGRTRVFLRPDSPDDQMADRIRTQFTYDPVPGRSSIQAEEITTPLTSHETAISFAQGRVVRIDSTFVSTDARAVLDVFREGLGYGHIQAPYPYFDQMVFGTFFQKDEWRFEFSAYTWEGEDFITTNEPHILWYYTNPYAYAPIPYCKHLGSIFDDPRVNFDHFRTTNAYRHEYWFNWNWCFNRNGIRGNCEVFDNYRTCLDWEIDNWVVKHNNLGQYAVVCPDPSIPALFCTQWFKPWTLCTGEHLEYPGGHYVMEDKFYDDLEECHVAMLTAHGGPVNDINYHFQPYRDIWARVHTAGLDGLGRGKLRHLFFASCAAMNWHEEEPYSLPADWHNNHVADGIRSVFGMDGAFYASPFNEGLIFFRFYHSGDSVSDSWTNMAMTIDLNNVPVGIGYGNKAFDALGSLLDQRFNRTRAGNAFAATLTLVD